MKRSEPLHYLWWLVSRASGVVALVLVTLAVLMGLAMASKMLRRPGVKRTVVRLHEHVALTALAAIALHGVALLGDQWLKPGWRGITIPFALGYRPLYTGIGIIAGYLVLLVGPSFYVRRRIGAKRWRTLHRLSVVIWLLAAGHTLGAGSDAPRLWLRAVVAVPLVPVAYLFVLRLLRDTPRGVSQRHAARAGADGQSPVRREAALSSRSAAG